MVPLRPEAHEHVLLRLGVEEAPGLLALRHAILFRKPGLWGDDARRPHSVLLLRPAGPGREAFGAGRAEPAVAWLAARQGRIALVAPEEWEPTVRSVVGPVDRHEIVTWFDPPLRESGTPPRAEVRRLGRNDHDAFLDLAPDWALRGWGSYDDMTRHGAAFGVPHGDGLASVAWVQDQTERFDSIAVFTRPRYRRLGLGRAAARAAIRHTQRERGKLPLWSAAGDNPSSHALARALGFTGQSTELLLRWPAERPVEEQETDEVRL
jgi:GNAT superfamily N-acetyltransferase